MDLKILFFFIYSVSAHESDGTCELSFSIEHVG